MQNKYRWLHDHQVLLWLISSALFFFAFLFTLDTATLSQPIEQGWDHHLRQLLILFVLPLAGLVFCIVRFRNRIREFWFSYGVPISLFVIVTVWLTPAVMQNIMSDGVVNDEPNAATELSQTEEPTEASTGNSDTGTQDNTAAPQEELIDSPPVDRALNARITLWLALLAIACVVSIIVYRLRQFSVRHSPTLTAEQKTVEILSALQREPLSHNYRDFALRAYAQLLQLAETKADIARRVSFTPAEFQRVLIQNGLPETAIKTLTEAFQRARYGHEQTSSEQVTALNQAIDEIKEALNRV